MNKSFLILEIERLVSLKERLTKKEWDCEFISVIENLDLHDTEFIVGFLIDMKII